MLTERRTFHRSAPAPVDAGRGGRGGGSGEREGSAVRWVRVFRPHWRRLPWRDLVGVGRSLHLPCHCRDGCRCCSDGRRSGRVIPLLLDFLSAYRLTRLITSDTILDGPRDALVAWAYGAQGAMKVMPPEGWAEFAQNDPDAPKLATLITCRWCSGAYVSAAVVIARRRWPRQWAPIAEALALSAGAALIAGLED